MNLLKVSSLLRNAILAVLFFLFAGNSFAFDFDGVKEGSIITFGRYPQTESGEIKPIEWRVLEVKDNKAFLLADKGLDAVPYNIKRHDWKPTHAQCLLCGQDATWKTSSIRQWLNTDFYNAAFSDSEKSRIVITVLNNPDNPKYGTKGGDDTRDRIFLLSFDEAEWYLMYDSERILELTPYAIKSGARCGTKLRSSWWLRSPGNVLSHASDVLSDGTLDLHGYCILCTRLAVRPALWLNL